MLALLCSSRHMSQRWAVRSPLRASSTSFNVSMMFYRSNVRDYGLDENLNICPRTPAVPSEFMDVSSCDTHLLLRQAKKKNAEQQQYNRSAVVQV